MRKIFLATCCAVLMGALPLGTASAQATSSPGHEVTRPEHPTRMQKREMRREMRKESREHRRQTRHMKKNESKPGATTGSGAGSSPSPSPSRSAPMDQDNEVK